MAIVDVSYNRHGACGCAYYALQHGGGGGGLGLGPTAAPESPIIRGIDEEEIVDRILAMRRQEDSAAYRVAGYLSSSVADAAASAADPSSLDDDLVVDIDADCRAKMAEWFYQLVDFCRVDRDNVAVAMSYLDRFLSAARVHDNDRARGCLSDRREYQLAAMTCLYLAVNISETREMDTGLLVELSHGKYAKSDFVAMAEDITFGLGWRLNGPTSMAFVNHLLGLLPPSAKHVHERELPPCCRSLSEAREAAHLHELCRVQAELAVSDYGLVDVRPSDLAVAAVRNAMEQARPDAAFSFLRSLDRADVKPFGPEVERARAVLKLAFAANVDGLRQVTSLLRLGEDQHHHPEQQQQQRQRHHHVHVSTAKERASFSSSARCVGEVARIQDRDKLRREIGEGATP